MTDFVHDRLAQRLRQLEITTPDASRVAAGALSAHRRPSRSGRRTLLLAFAMAPLLTLIVTTVAAYYAPAFSQVLADAPIAGRVAGPILRQFGLASIEERVSSFGDRTASSGYTVELVGGYADSSRTVLFLRVTPAVRVVLMPELATLRDQFGHEYRMSSGLSDSETGDAAITFAPIQAPSSRLGARLTLTLTQLEDRGGARPNPIAGRWELQGTLLPDEGNDLPLPAPGDLGPAHVAFTKLRALPAALLLEIEMNGISPADVSERIPDGLKGRAAFTVRLVDPTGRESRLLAGSGGTSSGNESAFRQQWLWEVETAGRYELVLTWEGRGTLTRTLVVH